MYAADNRTIIDRREMLRVKVKSLAAEARIIRREELRTRPGPLREELRYHRTHVLRIEARAAHLAYGFVRGLTREQMEPKRTPIRPASTEKALMAKVQAMVQKYGPRVVLAPAPVKIAA